MTRYGAPEAAWKHFADTLNLTADLLPIVANPNAVIAARSTMKAVGKTPSVYDAHREVVGLGKWTERVTSRDTVERWAREPDYALSLQCRTVRAIDVDIPDPVTADAVEAVIVGSLGGVALPKRYRDNSGKRLFAFRYAGEMPKRVIPVEGGIIEFLGDGQQFVAAGNHDSGVPYRWDCDDGLPAAIPTLTDDELEAVWSTLVALFATADPTIARQRRGAASDIDIGPTTDSFGLWLAEHWDVYDTGRDGELYIRCPFESEHTSDSGETSTAYFLAGTGGYERGHVKCLHAHCMGRDDHDYQVATGYIGAGFAALPVLTPVAPAEPRRPTSRYYLPEINVSEFTLPDLVRDKQGRIEASSDNINKLLIRPDILQMRLATDKFKEELVWASDHYAKGEEQWERFTDADYTRIKILLERIGMKSVNIDTIRGAVHFAACQYEFDSAQIWLGRLKWDGVSRVSGFLERYIGVEPSDYAAAVSRYLWTALAGRVLAPGCQADMVPVFYGAQGTRKTSAIKAIAPTVETYTDINLTDRDTDLSRRLRGRLVGELEELRGLRSRDAEAVKAWITRTHEDWVPKFKEFSTQFARRLVLIASTNDSAFLADDSGERRWLPVEVATHGPIDIDALKADCEQLWAEGVALYGVLGVDWQDAERLARDVHVDYKVNDAWTDTVRTWLWTPDISGAMPATREDGLSATDVLQGAIGLPVREIDHGRKLRINKVLRTIGLEQKRVGKVRDRRWFLKGE